MLRRVSPGPAPGYGADLPFLAMRNASMKIVVDTCAPAGPVKAARRQWLCAWRIAVPWIQFRSDVAAIAF
jgi:hypothetical protein